MKIKKFDNFINEDHKDKYYELNDKYELIDKLARAMYSKYLETLKYYHKNPDKLKSDFELHSESNFDNQPEEKREIDYKWAKKIMNIINPYLNK